MNALESYFTTSPDGKTEECARFTIDTPTESFVLTRIANIEDEYVLSFWVKSDANGSISVCGSTVSSSTDWSFHVIPFVAKMPHLPINFDTVGVYYIYHPQLENGNIHTGWTPSPDDVIDDVSKLENANSETNGRISSVEASLQVLAGSVVTVAKDEENNVSTLRQEGTGWTFSLSDLESTVNEALDALTQLTEERESTQLAIDTLKGSVAEHSVLADYIVIGEYNGQPCIELGEVGGEFKLRITNTEMYFMSGSLILSTVTNQKMIAETIEVKQELQHGDFTWVVHGSGNLGVKWRGVSS